MKQIKTEKDKDRLTLTLQDRGGETTDAQQLQYLVEFVEEFKNYMDFQHIADLLKFVLLPMLQDEGRRNRFINALDAARAQEETEIAERLQEDPEALLDSIPHNGLALIKNTLQDFQAMSDTEREAIIKQLYRTPDVLNMMNTKATNVIFDPKRQEAIKEPLDLIVSGGKKEIVVPTQVFISVLDEDGVQLPQSLTAYDRMVYDGVCTVIANNPQRVATASQIYTAFAGKGTRSPQAMGHITRSLNKLANTTIYLDYTEHARSKGINLDKMRFSGKLLNFYSCEIESGGQKTWGYVFLDTPILYRYAATVGQIITVDRALLDVNTINNTDNANLIKTYLLRRIETMKAKHNGIYSNRIKYDSMIDYLSIQAGSKAEKKRIRDTVKAILDYWKARHYIKGYAEYKEGRTLEGVEIKY